MKVDEVVSEVFDIKYFLSLGISLEKQGYDTLDYDIALMLKYIGLQESKIQNEKNPTNVGFNLRK